MTHKFILRLTLDRKTYLTFDVVLFGNFVVANFVSPPVFSLKEARLFGHRGQELGDLCGHVNNFLGRRLLTVFIDDLFILVVIRSRLWQRAKVLLAEFVRHRDPVLLLKLVIMIIDIKPSSRAGRF